jgi:hypothetical protein
MTAKQPTLTPAEREDYTERAAILEFEAGLPRAEAERRALAIVVAKRCDESRTSGRR